MGKRRYLLGKVFVLLNKLRVLLDMSISLFRNNIDSRIKTTLKFLWLSFLEVIDMSF